jgi:hypothetical protein
MGTDLLSSGARISRAGTFPDYLNVTGTPPTVGQIVTLHDALSRIIEIQFDYTNSYRRESLVIPIDVEAYVRGGVRLYAPRSLYDFSLSTSLWTTELPSLANCCRVETDKNALRVLYDFPRGSFESVAAFCSLRLERSLLWQDNARWFTVRRTDPNLVFPRASYYFIAMFILGSIVRYEPELLIEVSSPGSRSAWFLQKVVQAAERFFPQLMISQIFAHPFYF